MWSQEAQELLSEKNSQFSNWTLSSPVNWDSKAQNDRWEESERWVFEPRIMVDDIASGTLQPLLKILNGHLRSWGRDQASGTGIFTKLKIAGHSKPQLVSLKKPQKKRISIFLQNKHKSLIFFLREGRCPALQNNICLKNLILVGEAIRDCDWRYWHFNRH